MNQEDVRGQYIEEDTIDLRELWATLMKRKVLVLIATSVITILAIVYVLVKTPKYEASALIEIGNYKLNNNNNNNNNKNVLLDDASQLVKKLNVLYIDMFKGVEGKEVEITSIVVPKNQTNFISIKALGLDNEIAKKEILKVLSYIQQKHQKILDDVKRRRELEIKNIESTINSIQTKELKSIEDKIELVRKDLKNTIFEKNELERNIKNLKKSDPSWLALNIMQKRDLSRYIAELELSLIDLDNEKTVLQTTTINKLYEDQALVASMLLPYNYKNTNIIGDIITSKYPVKPKKKLIVVVAFITGLMLSVFLAFFLEFIQGGRKEEKKKGVR